MANSNAPKPVALADYGLPDGMLQRADKDPDAASFWTFGESIEKAVGCVVVIKGNAEARYVREMLIGQKLMRTEPIPPLEEDPANG
jgi:hypothetical protein